MKVNKRDTSVQPLATKYVVATQTPVTTCGLTCFVQYVRSNARDRRGLSKRSRGIKIHRATPSAKPGPFLFRAPAASPFLFSLAPIILSFMALYLKRRRSRGADFTNEAGDLYRRLGKSAYPQQASPPELPSSLLNGTRQPRAIPMVFVLTIVFSDDAAIDRRGNSLSSVCVCVKKNIQTISREHLHMSRMNRGLLPAD